MTPRILPTLSLLGVLLLTGCASAAAPGSSASMPASTAGSTPSSSATETTEPAASQAFGGDCAAVFSEEELASEVGLPMELLTRNWSLGTAEAHGGVQCTWATPEPYMGITVDAVVLPADEVPAAFAAGQSCTDDVYGSPCQVTVIEDGVWYRLGLSMTVSGADHAALSETLAAQIVDRGAALPRPVAPAALAGTWEALPSCEDLASALDANTAPSAGAPVTAVATPAYDLDASSLWTALGRQACDLTFTTDSGATAAIQATLVPGGGATFEAAVAAHGDVQRMPLTVGEAAVVPAPAIWEGHGAGMYATDGANTILLTATADSAFPETALAASGGLFDQLFSIANGS